MRIDSSSCTTDDKGEFVLRDVTPGSKTVLVRADGQFYQMEAVLPGEGVLELPESAPRADSGSPSAKQTNGERPRRRPRK